MKINIKGHIRDLLAFRNLVPARRKRIAKAPAQLVDTGKMNKLAKKLHPTLQSLIITDVRNETHTVKTFRLAPDPDSDTRELAYFRAGQYLSLKVELNGSIITRPYSISSAPFESLGADGFYEVTIQKRKDGFFTPYLWDNWAVGSKIQSSGPCGEFYHEPLRDSSKIVGLAGGCGITPFCSMAKEIVHGNMDAQLLLLYGSNDKDEIIYKDLFKELEQEVTEKIKVVHVLNCDEIPSEGCEQGFITASLIEKYADIDNSSFFICGPQAMYEFVMKELDVFGLPRKRIRREVFGEPGEITGAPGYPKEMAEKVFKLIVHIGDHIIEIQAQANETVLVAMERSGLAPPSQCRSGECGVCHSLLLSGDVYVHPECDGRRAADLQYGYIHPCASYPITNLEISVPRG